jgi:hypothetical protein
MDCIPLAAAATTLWVAYHALYMQMCSYRDGQVSDDEALTYGKVRDFLLVSVTTANRYLQVSGVA